MVKPKIWNRKTPVNDLVEKRAKPAPDQTERRDIKDEGKKQDEKTSGEVKISEVKETSCTVAITGKLNDFSSREKAKNYLTPLGVKVISSISSKTNYLVCDIESSNSSSYKKAIKLNIPIITMNNLLNDILKENN